MKNSFAFYQGAAPGFSGLAARIAGASGLRDKGEAEGMKDAAHMDLYGAQAEEARSKAAGQQARQAALADEVGGLGALSGLAAPLARKAAEYFRTGAVRYEPLTPNDDEGNVMSAAVSDGAPPELRPHLPALTRARQTMWAAQAGGGNADQLSKAAGNFQEQAITDAVQAKLREAALANPVDAASAMNQGGKIGQKIDRFSTGAGGMTINDATGETVAGAANNKAVADLRAAMQSAGIDPDGAQAKELFKQLAVKMTTHPGIVAPNLHFVTDAKGNVRALDPKTGEERPIQATDGAGPLNVGNDKLTADLDRKVTHFAEQMQKTNIPQFEAILADLKGELAKYVGKDVPGVGQTGMLPNFLLTPEGKALRQKIATLRNTELKDRSGAAVTDNELRRYLEELGTGAFSTDKQLLDAIGNIETRFGAVKQNAAAGVGDDVLSEYMARGGTKLERGPAAAAPGVPSRTTPSTPAAPGKTSGSRPPLSNFDKGASRPASLEKVGAGQVGRANRIAILQDEYAQESAVVPKDAADRLRKQVNLQSLSRELRALGVTVGGA